MKIPEKIRNRRGVFDFALPIPAFFTYPRMTMSCRRGGAETWLTECIAAASEACITMAVVPESMMADLIAVCTLVVPTLMPETRTSQYLHIIACGHAFFPDTIDGQELLLQKSLQFHLLSRWYWHLQASIAGETCAVNFRIICFLHLHLHRTSA